MTANRILQPEIYFSCFQAIPENVFSHQNEVLKHKANQNANWHTPEEVPFREYHHLFHPLCEQIQLAGQNSLETGKQIVLVQTGLPSPHRKQWPGDQPIQKLRELQPPE